MLGIIGDLVQDVVVWLAEPVQHGTDTAAEIFHTRGGSGANVAACAARLGPTGFIGCVGDDDLGASLADGLAAEGVDVRVQRRGSTGTIVILIDENAERTMLPHRGASTLLDEVPDAWLDRLELLHVPAYTFDGEPIGTTVVEVIRRAKKRGVLVSVDASSTGMLSHYGVQRFLDLMADLRPNFLIANEGEAAFLGLSAGGVAGLNRDLLPETVVVAKAGPNPTVVHVPGGERVVVPVPPVERIRDLTGAGDAFAAGFLTAYLATHDLHEACVGGHGSAARVLASPGSTMAPDPSAGPDTSAGSR
ncbi:MULTISPECIES: carbohydrate kinase family protein [unclassified Streptomyces]|uniref:carbohydrate kinase family protein n=1 Tax=unclassified Streptomyces TaxID=2593676 RepID=UPI0036EB4B87